MHLSISGRILLADPARDDESLPLNNIATGKLGTIELGVTRMRRRGVLSYNPAPLDIKGIGPMHEKSKKVGGHCVSCVMKLFGLSLWLTISSVVMARLLRVPLCVGFKWNQCSLRRAFGPSSYFNIDRKVHDIALSTLSLMLNPILLELLRAQSIIEPPRVTDPVQSGSGNVSVKRSRSAAFPDNNRVGNSSSTSQVNAVSSCNSRSILTTFHQRVRQIKRSRENNEMMMLLTSPWWARTLQNYSIPH